jgi:outer membrane efflux protein
MFIEEVRRAHAAYLATGPIVERVGRVLVPLAELKLRQAELRFTAGEAGLTEVLSAEQDLRRARASLIELEQKSAAALIRLERAVGGPQAAAGLFPSDKMMTPQRSLGNSGRRYSPGRSPEHGSPANANFGFLSSELS